MKQKFIVVRNFKVSSGGPSSGDYIMLLQDLTKEAIQLSLFHTYHPSKFHAHQFSCRASAMEAIDQEFKKGSRDIYQVEKIYVCNI